MCLQLCTDWKNGQDLNLLSGVNGVQESLSVDGSIAAHIQVMIIQSLKTVFLILHVLDIVLVNSLDVGLLLHSLSCEGCEKK